MKSQKKVTVITNIEQFELSESDNVLTALLARGYDIEYQCRSGYCGSCRTKIIEGSVEYKEEPLAFIEKDEILPCCCTLKESITIDR